MKEFITKREIILASKKRVMGIKKIATVNVLSH